MKKTLIGAILFGLLGCQNPDSFYRATDAGVDTSADMSTDVGTPMCPRANTDVVSYQDCGGKKLNGWYCIETCGRLPDDGGLGALLPVGCTVFIGASTPLTALCVNSCDECN